MSNKVDRFMVFIGFAPEDIEELRHRRALYAANITMFAIAFFVAGMAVNAWVF